MDFLKEVEKNLDLPIAEKKQVMKELEAHYHDLREEYLESGMSASQADQEAVRKLGDPADIAQKMQSVHCKLGWKTALMMALPVIALACIRLLMQVFQLLHLFHRPLLLTPGAAISGQLLHTLRLEALISGGSMLVVAGIFLYPAIRDWQSGRRPIWLVTWMAVGMSAVSNAAGSAFRFFYLLHPPTMPSQSSAVLPNLLSLLVWGIFGLWLLKDMPRWRNFAAGVIALGIVVLAGHELIDPGSIVYPWYLIWVYATLLVNPLLLIPAGIGGFGRRPYGNAAQASLFLWTCGGANFIVASSNNVPWLSMITHVVAAVVIITAVFVYARQTSWIRKTYTIASAMVAVALINSVRSYSDMNILMQQTMLLIWSLLIVIIAPTMYGVRQSKQRPQAV